VVDPSHARIVQGSQPRWNNPSVRAKVDKLWVLLFGRYVVGPTLSGQAKGPALRISSGSRLAHIIQIANAISCT
jgi:hypothetical protein